MLSKFEICKHPFLLLVSSKGITALTNLVEYSYQPFFIMLFLSFHKKCPSIFGLKPLVFGYLKFNLSLNKEFLPSILKIILDSFFSLIIFSASFEKLAMFSIRLKIFLFFSKKNNLPLFFSVSFNIFFFTLMILSLE